MVRVPTTTRTTFGGLFGLGKTTGFTPVLIKKKGTRSARSKKPSVKRTTAAKKKTQRGSVRGHRRSTRLTLNITNKAEEEVSIDDEPMEISTLPTAKPSKMKTEISDTNLADDELLDINQTRRLVRKCVARNKLNST